MNWKLVLGGLLIHLTFFYSIFEIYFTSPIVHGMPPQSNPLSPPARRVVFFSADGLRADKLFELDKNGKTRAPFLRSVIEKHGAWGVSHTRVPTESRPGHVAMIAGFYEDVSAVAKGWKENPVEFDSVFNQSRNTWAWGSPDIIPMFAKGSTGDHVITGTYPAESEDFAGSEAYKLDTWVFDQAKDLLAEAGSNMTLSLLLSRDKVIFFLHLLGLDTNGHSHKPYSTEYLENIAVVDEGIKEFVNVVENYYGDDQKTAYVMSSDHGMTEWGSHGAGHPTETLTPLVAWGAGIRSAQSPTEENQYTDNFQKEWNLSNVEREDIHQADICPLLSTLAGINFPVNSVGTIHVDLLNTSQQFKAEALFANARQMVAQFEVKLKEKQQTTLSVFFTPFSSLTPSLQADKIRLIRNLIQNSHFQQAILESRQMISLALQGLNYYHNYDRFFLGTSISLGFLGWMSYVVTLILQQHTNIVRPRLRIDVLSRPFWRSEKGIRLMFTCLGALVTALLYVQSLPWTHYLYCLIPVALWHKVTQKLFIFKDLWWYIVDQGMLLNTLMWTVLGFAGIEIMVLSFFFRELLTVGLFCLAAIPFFTHLAETSKGVTLGWVISCLALAIFPLLPVVGQQRNLALVYFAGVAAVALAGSVSIRKETGTLFTKKGQVPFQVRCLTICQLTLVLVAVVLVFLTSRSISNNEGLPAPVQVASWTILGISFIQPMLSSKLILARLVNTALAFLPPYLLLSTGHEGIFYLALCTLLYFWLLGENKLLESRKIRLEDLQFGEGFRLEERQRKLVLADIRCAYLFIYLLLAAFFGTGNIASINSFDPTTVYCFLTVFSPFTMGALLLWKILIPFILVTCMFNAIHLTLNVPTRSLFLLVMFMSDFMALHFFFLVTDSGSWLEIGTSISHYVIVMCLICFLCLLLGLAHIITHYSLGVQPSKQHSN